MHMTHGHRPADTATPQQILGSFLLGILRLKATGMRLRYRHQAIGTAAVDVLYRAGWRVLHYRTLMALEKGLDEIEWRLNQEAQRKDGPAVLDTILNEAKALLHMVRRGLSQEDQAVRESRVPIQILGMLCRLMMNNDPTMFADDGEEEMTRWLNEQCGLHGYENWIIAFHEVYGYPKPSEEPRLFEGEPLIPDDPYTAQIRLCNNEGMVSGEYLEQHNRLKAKSRPDADPAKEPFTCTGSAHIAGEHILCTSPVHTTRWIPDPTSIVAGGADDLIAIDCSHCNTRHVLSGDCVFTARGLCE